MRARGARLHAQTVVTVLSLAAGVGSVAPPPPPYGGAGNVTTVAPGLSVGLFVNDVSTSDFEVPQLYPAYYRESIEYKKDPWITPLCVPSGPGRQPGGMPPPSCG